jgi:hypothetical protein
MLFPLPAPLKGVNTTVSPLIHPPDQPAVLNGCTNSFILGSITKDTGYSRVGDQIQANKSILGLYHFIQNSTTEKMFAVSNDSSGANTQLKYRSNGSGNWSTINVGTTWNGYIGQNVEMQGFIGYCFFVGVDSSGNFLPVASVTGTTFSTVTNVTSMPQGKYVIRYRDRLYVMNCYYGATAYPFRVMASSPVTAGAITWDTTGSPTASTGGFLDVDFSHEITGGAENWDRMMVFTDKAAYFYDQTQFKKLWNEGCTNHRTIKNKGAYMIWANNDGVWVSTGGQPQNISGEVRDFIKNASPASFFAEIVDEVYHLYVGTVTVKGVTYSNCTLKFNIANSNWEWREYYNQMTIFGVYRDSTFKKRLYMGDTTGTVWDKGKYYDSTLVSADAQTTAGTGGQPIGANFELAPFSVDDLGDWKIVRDLYIFADRAQGVNMRARVINRNTRILTPYKPIGQLVDYVNTFQVNTDNGVLLQIEGTEYSTNPYFSYLGGGVDIDKQSIIPRKSRK